jgi:hypothetical protein
VSNPTSRATLVRLRQDVVDGVMTAAQAAASVGITRGTLCSRWRRWRIVESMPIVPRHTTRHAVAAVIADDPSLSDSEISARLTAEGIQLNTSSVRGHRVSLGIGNQRDRMQAADPGWRHPTWRPKKVTDDELRESRRRVECRQSTVRRVAAELKISTTSLYDGWKRLGLVQERPSGFAADTRAAWCHRSPVRDEVAAHLRDYPWMTARNIADSMTADGYRITPKAVHHHLKALRIQAAG